MTARELVDALLAVTPLPPTDVTVDELLATFSAIATSRQAILDAVREVAPFATADDRSAARELTARQEAWAEALATARDTVGSQRVGNAKVRAYAAGV